MAIQRKHPQSNLRIPEDLKLWAKNQAASENRTFNNFVVKILEDVKNGVLKNAS